MLIHAPYSLLLEVAEGELSALHYQNLSSIWCFLLPLHCLLFSESSVMDKSVRFSFRSATFFLIVFQSFLCIYFKSNFSFVLLLCYLIIFSSKIAKIFNSYQTRESACTLKVFILAHFSVIVLVQGFLFPRVPHLFMLC